MIRSLVVVLAVSHLPGCFVGCNPAPSPSSESCETPGTAGAVTDLAIGRYDGTAFTRYDTDDIVPITEGGQGFPMLVFNLLVRGSDVPACLDQETTVTAGGVVEGSESLPLTTTQVQSDTWVTGDALVVTFGVSGGDRVDVTADVGGVTRTVGLWVDYEGVLPDAAMSSDAL